MDRTAQSSAHRGSGHYEGSMIKCLRLSFLAPRRRLRRRAGNTILESGLCMLLFMTIFIAIMEFGMGIYAYNFVSYAAREGSRYASTRGTLSGSSDPTSDIQTRIQNQAVGFIDPSQVSVTTTWNPDRTP